MNPLAIFAGPYAMLARIGVLAVVALAVWGHGFWKGNEHGTEKLVNYQAAEAKADTELAAARQVVVTQIQTKYVDRIKVVREQGETITKEVHHYVTQQDDAVPVPVGFVRVFNAAWSGTPPGPPADADRGPSGYPLSAVADAGTNNATTCRVWKEQRDGVIEFYRKQQALGG